MAALTQAARLALLASAASATPELPALYGMAGIALPNGAIYAAELALGPIDASGDAVALSSAAVVDDVHFLDGMSSGCGFVVDGGIAYTVGYSCDALPYKNCPPSANMSLFGVDVATGTVKVNVSTPLPWWENLDDHHTNIKRRANGDLVITGIMNVGAEPRPLVGGVVVMWPDGTVLETHVISQNWGEYIKGPTGLDDRVVYLSTASLGAEDAVPLLKYDLATRTQTEIALPHGLIALDMDFDSTAGGLWVLASNATKILESGYQLVFVPREGGAATVRDLGRGCLSLENPSDNWSSTAVVHDGVLVAAAPCQPDAASINTHLLFVDVKTATIAASPMIYPVPLVAGDNRTAQVFGIAARGA